MSILLDFVDANKSVKKDGRVTIEPGFNVITHDDILLNGKTVSVWDASNEEWTSNMSTIAALIDTILDDAAQEEDGATYVKHVGYYSSSNKTLDDFKKYCKDLPQSKVQMDQKLTFKSDRRKKNDFCTKRLSFDLNKDVPHAYDKLVTTLYDPEELEKYEWFMGSIVSGDFVHIQKFVAITGSPGTGKSTLLNVAEKVLGRVNEGGYVTVFNAKKLTGRDNRFALSQFRNSPILAVDHDADLSRITDNSLFNSVVAHEMVPIELKGVDEYEQIVNSMLLVASNKDVLITDGQSGLLRRLIDVSPSGRRLDYSEYMECMAGIDFEKGAICNRWLDVYNRLGRNYYDQYVPMEMLYKTNDIYNFVMESYDFLENDGYAVSGKIAYERYKNWCSEAGVDRPLIKRDFNGELANYYDKVYIKSRNATPAKYLRDGDAIPYRGFVGFNVSKYKSQQPVSKVVEYDLPQWLDCDDEDSEIDSMMSDSKAQYKRSNGDGPRAKWANCKTTLKDIDTHLEHYVKPPSNMVVIDFDIPDKDGNKDRIANLRAAAEWPPTYAEYSRSGQGLHLHYFYEGDVSELADCMPSNPYIEIKKFPEYTGASLRRKLTYCNNYPIATIRELPLKKRREKKKVLDSHEFKSEAQLRRHIERNLRKEFGATKPSIDFIYNALEKAYASGMKYDVSDLRPDIWQFACSSTHQANYCAEKFNQMKFSSEKEPVGETNENMPIVFFDIEIFPNLFIICYKFKDEEPVRTMINPTPDQIETILPFRLIGFNNRRYDNHIVYAATLGYSPGELYELSQRLINYHNDGPSPYFRQAYNLSYADIWDFSSNKQSLKKFEIDLHIHHQECPFPWDEPVQKEKWPLVADYCKNDVIATEATFNARQGDFVAREILAEISGLKVNDSTRQHATRILFGNNRNPQSEFVYTKLNTIFPGYEFDNGTSTYMNEVVGEGGYVYAEPGMYGDVTVLDVASMHPTSIIELNLFGDRYTKRFKELVDLRLAIKHGDFDKARHLLDGKAAPYLDDESKAGDLANALKIVINSIYGFTAARFPCEFRDPRNVDNIVAKRGALFMINLKHEVQKRGFTVAHIKTDSIKIPDATPEIIDFVTEYGKEYGYTFEIENTFDRFCLVNDAVYIARHTDGKWDATGAEFQVPYVFKTLFSHEELEFDDLCVTKSVSGDAAIYLDRNEGLQEGEHNYIFVGKTGQFCPLIPNSNGGYLLRKPAHEDRYSALAGTKGRRWDESENVRILNLEGRVDVGYFEDMADSAVQSIEKYGDFSQFVKE